MAGRPEDAAYLEALLAPVRKCAAYKPKFGSASGRARDEDIELDVLGFQRLYGADPLYAWLGLNSPLMYAAHKAAGGMTSIYRQIGIGCERLVRTVLGDTLGLTKAQMQWAYETADERGKAKKLTLDARVKTQDISDRAARSRFAAWLEQAGRHVKHPEPSRLNGVIFEIRQGYKSADSKRQNADLRFGNRAGLEGYLPAIMIMSTQISVPVIQRYKAASLLVLTGTSSGDSRESTLAFFEHVIGYSLSDFFRRNTGDVRRELETVLQTLLSPVA